MIVLYKNVFAKIWLFPNDIRFESENEYLLYDDCKKQIRIQLPFDKTKLPFLL